MLKNVFGRLVSRTLRINQQARRRSRSAYECLQAEVLEPRRVMTEVEPTLIAVGILPLDQFPEPVKEQGGMVKIDVTRSGGVGISGVDVTYTVGQSSDTAKFGVDYSGVKTGVLRFSKNDTVKPIYIKFKDDLTDEFDENFVVTLTKVSVPPLTHNVGTYLIPGEESAIGVITDDDPPPKLIVSRGPGIGVDSTGKLTINEENAVRLIYYKLSRASGKSIELDVELRDNHAYITYGNGEDYSLAQYVGSGAPIYRVKHLIFNPGKISESVSIQVYEDKIAEDDELFSLIATDRGSGNLDVYVESYVKIIDDDVAVVHIRPAKSSNPGEVFVFEDGAPGPESTSSGNTAEIDLVIGTESERTFSVEYKLVDGTAKAGDPSRNLRGDYLRHKNLYMNVSGRHKIGDVVSGVGVTVYNDSPLTEPAEFFFVNLVPSTSAKLRFVRTSVKVFILDGDAEM